MINLSPFFTQPLMEILRYSIQDHSMSFWEIKIQLFYLKFVVRAIPPTMKNTMKKGCIIMSIDSLLTDEISWKTESVPLNKLRGILVHTYTKQTIRHSTPHCLYILMSLHLPFARIGLSPSPRVIPMILSFDKCTCLCDLDFVMIKLPYDNTYLYLIAFSMIIWFFGWSMFRTYIVFSLLLFHFTIV